MRKDLHKSQRKLPLQLNRETLRLLEPAELQPVKGAAPGTSSCAATWYTCCYEN